MAESEPVLATANCALCGEVLAPGPLLYVNQQPACQRCIDNIEAELAAERPPAASYVPAALGGLAGALVGAGVWAAIAMITDLEVGYVAVLVGFLAGYGVKLAARGRRGLGLQILAAALAVVGLLAAKIFIIGWVLIRGARAEGIDVAVLDPRVLGTIFEVLPQTFSMFDLLWIVLAVGAAYRMPAPTKIQVHGG